MINADYNRDEIRKAIETALSDELYQRRLAEFVSPLINKDTPTKIVNILCSIDINAAKRPKSFIDITIDSIGDETS